MNGKLKGYLLIVLLALSLLPIAWWAEGWVGIYKVCALLMFEVVLSLDNVASGSKILGTMSPEGQTAFLRYGLFCPIVGMRCLLPWVIVWLAAGIGFWEAFKISFSENPIAKAAIEASKPVLYSSGGIFLIMFFYSWLCGEAKDGHGLKRIEKFFNKYRTMLYYPVVFLALGALMMSPISYNMKVAIGAGFFVFWVSNLFKTWAHKKEEELKGKEERVHTFWTDASKFAFLEIIDAGFSVDGVFGAFSFTHSVLLILIGNGVGCLIIRKLMQDGVELVEKVPVLVHGGMYSVGVLGVVMMVKAFGVHVPEWLTATSTLGIMGFTGYVAYERSVMTEIEPVTEAAIMDELAGMPGLIPIPVEENQ